MKQWDICYYRFSKEGLHPAVIISSDERCENADLDAINVLLCTSARLNREPKKTEVILDESDGLNWKTAVRCDLFHLLPKSGIEKQAGSVSSVRRQEIARKIVQCLRLPLH